MLFKDVVLRTKRVIDFVQGYHHRLCTYKGSALLVLNGTSLNSVKTPFWLLADDL